MGVTTWACPGCGQAQREEHDNAQGSQKVGNLCAACQEKEDAKEVRDTRRERSSR